MMIVAQFSGGTASPLPPPAASYDANVASNLTVLVGGQALTVLQTASLSQPAMQAFATSTFNVTGSSVSITLKATGAGALWVDAVAFEPQALCSLFIGMCVELEVFS